MCEAKMNLADRTINPLTTYRAVFTQTKNATLPYTIDYGVLLNGDAITASEWTADGALNITSDFTTSTATVSINGTPGTYNIVNKITTAAGIVDERVLALRIKSIAEGRTGDYE